MLLIITVTLVEIAFELSVPVCNVSSVCEARSGEGFRNKTAGRDSKESQCWDKAVAHEMK